MKKQTLLITILCSILSVYSCKNHVNGSNEATENKLKKEPTSCIDSSIINLNAICTMDWNPVCGCDEKTYGNACVAENAGVTSYQQGNVMS